MAQAVRLASSAPVLYALAAAAASACCCLTAALAAWRPLQPAVVQRARVWVAAHAAVAARAGRAAAPVPALLLVGEVGETAAVPAGCWAVAPAGCWAVVPQVVAVQWLPAK